MPIAPRPPTNVTLATWSAVAVGGSYNFDAQMCDRVCIQINATITSAGTSAAKVQGSVDGTNWADIAGATASVTGTSAVFLIRLGQIDYRYVQLVVANPSAGALTGTAIAFCKGVAEDQ